ncbi:MAG: UbiA family prenyltransferase, partial [Nitrospirae bacterium]|nr:UbiA family prenyltransferase [Nitrospirota bacterium]
IDARMRRTRERPLPTGRLEPNVALASGSFLAVVSLTTLALVTNPLTTTLLRVTLQKQADHIEAVRQLKLFFPRMKLYPLHGRNPPLASQALLR